MTRAIHGPMSEAQRRGMQLEAARLAVVASLAWLERECEKHPNASGDKNAAGWAKFATKQANRAFDEAATQLEIEP